MRMYTQKPNIAFLNAINPSSKSSDLSPLGQAYASGVAGSTYIDLGSGHHRFSVMNRALAKRFGATSYIGVDIAHRPTVPTRKNEHPRLEPRLPFRSHYFREDMLSFLRRLERPGRLFFHIEEIEVRMSRSTGEHSREDVERAQQYLQQVMSELQRVTRSGDTLFIGETVSLLHPTRGGGPRPIISIESILL